MPTWAQALLAPRSVALVGASDDPSKPAGRPLSFLRRDAFPGNVYPVNARHSTVQGEHCWPSLDVLPEPPDHAFVMVPTESVLATLEECAKAGVRVATVLASGFAEDGPEGRLRQERVVALARRHGMRILGPSSLGLSIPARRLALTANAAFGHDQDRHAGGLFVASQSGSVMGALLSRGAIRGVGFSGLVSVGGEADLTIGEICSAALDDPDVTGYALFLESLRDGAGLKNFAREASRRGKPVVAYKIGRSATAAEMAATHTGALAGEDDVADAFLRGCGIARVNLFDALLDCAPLAVRMPLVNPGSAALRVGVLTTTGGGSAMLVDQLAIRGIEVQPPTDETWERLASQGIRSSKGRVVDLTLGGTAYRIMKTALDVMLQAAEFDLVITVIGSSARLTPTAATQPMIDSRQQGRPQAVLVLPEAPEALVLLRQADLPAFGSPEACAEVVAAVARRRPVSEHIPQMASAHLKTSRMLDEYDSYRVLEELGIPHSPVERFGLHTDDLKSFARIPLPAAAKLCSADIPHKSDVGGVVLHIKSSDDLADALGRLREAARNLVGARCEHVLVQSMQSGLVELLLGYRVDPEAGAILILAAGGTWTEVLKDRSIRLAPITEDVAYEMMSEVKVLATVRGKRGQQVGDVEALAKAMVQLSKLATDRPDVQEAEINPLLVKAAGEGVVAIDALVRVIESTHIS